MIGTWQSADDPSFTRAFDDSGKATERYAGDDSATAAGTWRLFSGSNPPPEFAAQGLEARAVYLELRERGDVLLFALTHADQATLQMISLARGNVLNFSRLK